MKKLSAGLPYIKFIAAASAFTWLIALATSASAAELKEARVTQVVNDVKLLLEQGAPRPAMVSELVRSGSAVRTGTQSRSELTFADLTITRLGANTIFSFNEGTREMNLVDGTILFQVPKGSGGATIRTVAVTATITGTTGIAEFHPATTTRPQPFSKWLCLEGMFRLTLPNGQSVEVGPGKMVTTDGKSFSKVSTFDIAKLVSTSLFFIGFDTPLPRDVLDLIALEEQRQADLVAAGFVDRTTNPLNPLTTANVIDLAIVAREAPTPPSPSVSPTPSKFGTPPVITSPVPYVITSGTTITTDPSITTNGVTDFGKIYRGPTDDGAFSLWAFGSTSAVDNALDFDTHFNNAGHFPAAAFKFTSLVLAGNPTIDLSNGGVTNLALISVGDITSGLPGGTLTFTGLDALLLASQNGSINLGSEITFQGIPTLFFYARGTNGDLTLASPIVGTTDLFLYAGRNITFNAGTDLIVGGQFSARSAGGNISVSEDGDISVGGSLAATTDVIANAATGGNITFGTGGSLSASNFDAETTVQPGITLNNGANITLDIGTDLTVNGGGALTLYVLNNDGGHIGTGGNISVTTGGDLTAGSIDALINNRNGGSIVSGGHIAFNIGAGLTTQGDATFGISMRNDGSGGGTIGSDATVDVNAASVSVGGAFTTFVSTNAGGSITGNAVNRVDATGDLVAQGPILATIQDTGFNQINPPVFIAGGHIGGNASVTLSGQNITTFSTASGIPGIDTMALEASIYTNGQGSIGGNAIVNVLASQNISAPGTVFFTVANGNYMGFGGGTIGGDAKLNISAVNFMAGILFAEIFNYGASIGGNANINFNLTGNLTAPGDALFHIFNYGGGNIVRNAAINVNAANITANSLLAEIDNSVGGTIGGNAAINMKVSGNANVTNDATFEILGSDRATAAAINIDGGSYNAGGTLLAHIDGNGTITFNNANLHADVLKAGVFGSNGTLNIGGGILEADTTLKLYASGSNGVLNFLSNVTLRGSALTKILAANTINILDNVVVTIGGSTPADVYTNHANYTGFGGNGTRTGTFAGAGAKNPQPLSSKPPFGPVSRATVRTGGHISDTRRARTAIHVSSSDELLSLLDGAAPGPGGKITIPRSKSTSNSRNSNRTDVADRLNAGSRLNAARRAMDMRTASSSVIRRSPQ